MSNGFGPQFLMIPGPAPVSDRVRSAMQRQSIDFSGNEFIDFANDVFERLKPVFGTRGEVFLYAANGHGAWEAALANTLNAGDSVLLPETGIFSEAWREMAHALRVETQNIPSDWRHAVAADQVERVLRADTQHKLKAVLIVHTDTAASVTTDLQAIRKAIDNANHPALLMADTIASLCTSPFEMDAWGIDVAIAASQKALMMPPGLALVAAGEKALAAAKQCTQPHYYWNWAQRLDGEHYKRFCGTAPEQLVFALGESLDMLHEEGLSEAIARHQQLADMVRAAVTVWSEAGFLEFNAINPLERANGVTSVRTPAGYDAEAIREAARRQHNVVIGGGFHSLRGKLFRIGHMGFLNAPYVLGALAAIEAALRSLNVPVGKGALDAALEVMQTRAPARQSA